MLTGNSYKVIQIDGFEVMLSYTKHSLMRMKERDVTKQIVELLLTNTPELLSLYHGDEFRLNDLGFHVTIGGSIYASGQDVEIIIHTVIDDSTRERKGHAYIETNVYRDLQ
ncbi:MAG: hypothetical protein ACRC5C_13180 [Bacilli bacterium]